MARNDADREVVMRVRRSVLGLLAILLAVAVAGCSAEVPTPTPTATAEPTPTPTPTATQPPLPFDIGTIGLDTPQGDPQRFAEMLALLPASALDEGGVVAINDYELMRQVLGVPLPSGDESVDELLDLYPSLGGLDGGSLAAGLRDLPGDQASLYAYVLALSQGQQIGGSAIGPAPWISGFGSSVHALFTIGRAEGQVCCPTRRYLGFDQRDVDMSAVTSLTPPNDMGGVVLGDIDPEEIDGALTGCDDCPVQPEIAEYLGHSYYRWGDDLAHNMPLQNAPPIYDQFGRGGSLLVRDGQAFHKDGALYIDVIEGNAPSIGDDEASRVLGEGMAKLGALSFMMGGPSWQVDDAVQRLGTGQYGEASALRASLSEGAVLRPFRGKAMGFGVDAEGPYLALALVHESADDAVANAKLLPRRLAEAAVLLPKDAPEAGTPWADRVRRMDVAVDGSVLLAKIRGEIASSWRVWWTDGFPPPFVHE